MNIPKKELDKLTDEHKRIAQDFAIAWNPLGNPDIFESIRENIFNFFLERKHTLDKYEIELIEDKLFRFCKGCEYEHDFKKCKNDHKKDMPKHKDGTLMCGYCAWKKDNNKRTQIFTIESKKGISPEELLGCLEDTISKEEWAVGEVVANKLYSLDEIKNILNHWRQDQGSLFDEETDIPG